ncbi:MAG: ribosomal-protein-serine acetyltransferase [Candidatus Aldehydirespiratoraceae bacterium]|jgi:ribosomal-protein-serine acetyltransferase
MSSDRPPDRLVGDVVVLVRSRPNHLDGLQAAVETSHAELHQFMDWAAVPQERPATLEFLATGQGAWRAGEMFNFMMTDPETGEVIGSCGLMNRVGPGRLEVGYWVRSDRAAAGIATAAARLLTTAGFGLDTIEAIEIHHDAANTASGRVAEKLGYTETTRRDVEIDCPGEIGVEVIWEISREGWL